MALSTPRSRPLGHCRAPSQPQPLKVAVRPMILGGTICEGRRVFQARMWVRPPPGRLAQAQAAFASNLLADSTAFSVRLPLPRRHRFELRRRRRPQPDRCPPHRGHRGHSRKLGRRENTAASPAGSAGGKNIAASPAGSEDGCDASPAGSEGGCAASPASSAVGSVRLGRLERHSCRTGLRRREQHSCLTKLGERERLPERGSGAGASAGRVGGGDLSGAFFNWLLVIVRHSRGAARAQRAPRKSGSG